MTKHCHILFRDVEVKDVSILYDPLFFDSFGIHTMHLMPIKLNGFICAVVSYLYNAAVSCVSAAMLECPDHSLLCFSIVLRFKSQRWDLLSIVEQNG